MDGGDAPHNARVERDILTASKKGHPSVGEGSQGNKGKAQAPREKVEVTGDLH